MDQPNMAPAPVQTPGGGKGKTIGIIVAVIIILLLGWYFTAGKKGSNDSGKMGGLSSKNTSLKELMGSGSAQNCQFTYQGPDGASSSGQIYLSGGKMRGTFTSTAGGQTIKSNMINDGQFAYTWMDGQTTGYKMAASAQDQQNTSGLPQGSQGMDPNNKYDYSCSGGGVPSDAFSLPAGIKFNDLSSMIPTAPAATATDQDQKAAMCAACGQAGTNKAQCLAALGCK